jgi:hypothetical protein
MKIRIKQYEQAADESVSLGGIKWLNKWDVCVQCDSREEAEALKARLAEPEQEPVAWRTWWPKMGGGYAWAYGNAPALEDNLKNEPLYTAPPQREWVGLTDEERRFFVALIGFCTACFAGGIAHD